MKTYPHTVLIVSHDRDLLNRAVGSILHLDKGKLTLYTGGYDDFEETRREKQRLEMKLMKKQDEQRRHLQAFIDRFKAKASKAAQAQSRVKALGEDAADRGAGRRSRRAVSLSRSAEDDRKPAAADREGERRLRYRTTRA